MATAPVESPSPPLALRPAASLHLDHNAGTAHFRVEEPGARIRSVVLSNLDRTALCALRNLCCGEATAPIPEKLARILVAHRLVRAAFGNRFRDQPTERTVEHFAEHCEDPSAAQDRLRAARVAVLGCGGTGSVLVQHLAGAGVQRFLLLDHDRVSATNLNRQYAYTLTDVGQLKTDRLAAYVRARVPDAEVRTITRQVTCPDDVPIQAEPGAALDLIACCMDIPAATIHATVAHAARRAGVPVLFGGVGLHAGTIGPLVCGEAGFAWYEEILQDRAARIAPSVRPTSASYGVTNAFVGGLMAHEAISYLSGVGDVRARNAHLHLNFSTHALLAGRRAGVPA